MTDYFLVIIVYDGKILVVFDHAIEIIVRWGITIDNTKCGHDSLLCFVFQRNDNSTSLKSSKIILIKKLNN